MFGVIKEKFRIFLYIKCIIELKVVIIILSFYFFKKNVVNFFNYFERDEDY